MGAANVPNVVLIVLDTARADAFEPYGAARGTTPAVAQLSSSGRAVQRAYAPSNWTMPSHASMFTGLLPRAAGLSLLPGASAANVGLVLDQHIDRLLPNVLRKNGYETLGASTNFWVSKHAGFDAGFDEFRDLTGKRLALMTEQGLRARLRWYAQALLANIDDGITAVDGVIQQWLERKTAPFFWFINLIECHSPYLPPRPYNDLGPIARLRAAQDARRYQGLVGVWKACATGIMPPDEAMERMRHLYLRSISLMDAWLGRLCERLERNGVLDDTLIVITSDHGENFGEGNLFGHAVSLDDRLIRVPLVLAGPGAHAVPDALTSLADLPAIIAGAVGIEDHPWRNGRDRAKAVVSQYDTGVAPDNPRLSVFREWGATADGYRRFLGPGTAATDGRYKLTIIGDEQRVYDMSTDPLEVSPVQPATVPDDVLRDLRRAVDESDATAWLPDLDTLQPRRQTGTEEIDDLESRMKLLGYM